MKARKLNSYRSSKSGNIVYRYEVSGTTTELENYKVSQGEKYVESDTTGKPLWFTTRYAGESVNLIITGKGNVIADMSEIEQANSLISQFPGPLGDAIAKATAEKILGSAKAVAPVANAVNTVAEVEIPAADTDLD